MNEIIDKINTVREQIKLLDNQEKQLLSMVEPIKCHISLVYSEFMMLKNIEKFETTAQKKLFIFVCLSIYCPSFILGDRIKSGVRNDIARITGLSNCRISNITNEVRFLYGQYKCFKTEADYLYNSIIRSLK